MAVLVTLYVRWALAVAFAILLRFANALNLFSIFEIPQIIIQILQSAIVRQLLAFVYHTKMDSQAESLEGVLKNNNASLPTKLALLAKLKANIKHQHVPLSAIPPCFEVVRMAISSPELIDQGFSILSHLTKRLLLQDQGSILASQAIITYPYIIDCMGDTKDRVRARAAQALTDFWTSFHVDVEQALRDTALASTIPAVKESAMQWIIKVRNATNNAALIFYLKCPISQDHTL